MKIAMIGLQGIPAKSGGIESVVENLAPLLVMLGEDVTVYCRNSYCKDKPKYYKGVKLRYLPTINTKHTEASVHSLLSTTDALFRDYDIIIYHAMGNGIFSIIPRIFGKKTVVTLHGLDWQREKWGKIAKLYLKISEKVISKYPNKVISVSKKIKRYYKERYNKDITYIPNGIHIVKPLALNKLKRFGLRKNKYLLFLSRIVPEKGVHTLIHAFRKVKTDMKLVIAGDATHTEEYLRQVKEMAAQDNRIIFTGPLYGNEKTEAFSNASVFILPSTIEGMPIVLLEAMSFGLCPLVSDIQENLDVICNHKYGYSFQSKNIKDLHRKLEYMINNPGKTLIKGKNARNLVIKKYDWQKISHSYIILFKEIYQKREELWNP